MRVGRGRTPPPRLPHDAPRQRRCLPVPRPPRPRPPASAPSPPPPPSPHPTQSTQALTRRRPPCEAVRREGWGVVVASATVLPTASAAPATCPRPPSPPPPVPSHSRTSPQTHPPSPQHIPCRRGWAVGADFPPLVGAVSHRRPLPATPVCKAAAVAGTGLPRTGPHRYVRQARTPGRGRGRGGWSGRVTVSGHPPLARIWRLPRRVTGLDGDGRRGDVGSLPGVSGKKECGGGRGGGGGARHQ